MRPSDEKAAAALAALQAAEQKQAAINTELQRLLGDVHEVREEMAHHRGNSLLAVAQQYLETGLIDLERSKFSGKNMTEIQVKIRVLEHAQELQRDRLEAARENAAALGVQL